MRRRIKVSILCGVVVCLAVAIWFEPTYCVRGWLRGEAFFDGRPTSYWRERCDEWLDRFDDEDSIKVQTWLLPFEIPEEPGLRRFSPADFLMPSSIKMPRTTYWKQCRDLVTSKENLERESGYMHAPKILWATPETASVLEELASEERYRVLTDVALRRVENYKRIEQKVRDGWK
jgi:hypothetical protein